MSESRTTTIWVKSGNTRIGKVIVNQKGSEEEAPYFYVGSSFEDAYETSATTYNYPAIESNDTSLKYVYYVTNMEGYFMDVVSGSDTINSAHIDDEQKHIVFVTNVNQGAERYATLVVKSENNDTLATINITQKGKSEYYFYWGDAGTATSTTTTAESEETTTTEIPYRTTYTNLTYNIVDSWITSVTLNNNTFVAGFSTNQGESDRTGTVQIKSGNDVVGTITITQKKPSVVYSIEVYPYNGSAGSTAQTSTTVTVTAINQGWSFNANETTITASPSAGNAGTTTVTLYIPAYDGTRTVYFNGSTQNRASFNYTQSDSPTPPTHTFYVTPSTGTLKTGETETITFSAFYDGSNVSTSCVWTLDSSIVDYVSISNGEVTLTASPATTLYDKYITATYSGREDHGLLTIEPEPVPDTLEVELVSDTIAYTGTTNAKAYYTESGARREITSNPNLEFSSDNESVATVSNSSYGTKGLVTGHATGTTNIYATYYSLTSNSVQLTVTGSPIDPDDPANWIWSEFRILLDGVRGGSETIQQTGRPEVNVEIMVSGMSEPYDITSKCGFIYKDDGSSSYGSSSNVGAVTLDGGNYKFVPSNTGETRIKATYVYNGTHETDDYITVTVQSEPVVHDYYLILSATSETSTLQTGVTETISFAALIRDNYDPSWTGNDVTNDCTWSITNGGTYAKTGTTKGNVQLKSNPTTQQTGTVKATYSYYSSATADFTILPPAAPQDELLSITVTIDSAPDIPASGGTVDCADVTYTVMAQYKNAGNIEVTNDASIECTGASATTKGTVPSDRTIADTLTIKASYTDGVTKTATASTTIYQEANIETTGTDYGRRDIQQSAWTVTSTAYEIGCDPSSKDVDSGANYSSVLVSALSITTEVDWTGETWTAIETPWSSYTSSPGVKYYGEPSYYPDHREEPVDTRRIPNSASVDVDDYDGIVVTRVRTAPIVTSGDPNYIVSWSENDTTQPRDGWASFKVVDDPSTTTTVEIHQASGVVPPTPTTRTITVSFNSGKFKNQTGQEASHPAASIEIMHCTVSYNSSPVIQSTFNDSNYLRPGLVTNYPTDQEWTSVSTDVQIDIPYDYTGQMTFNVVINGIELSDGNTGVSISDTCSITVGSGDTYTTSLPNFDWYNR